MGRGRIQCARPTMAVARAARPIASVFAARVQEQLSGPYLRSYRRVGPNPGGAHRVRERCALRASRAGLGSQWDTVNMVHRGAHAADTAERRNENYLEPAARGRRISGGGNQTIRTCCPGALDCILQGHLRASQGLPDRRKGRPVGAQRLASRANAVGSSSVHVSMKQRARRNGPALHSNICHKRIPRNCSRLAALASVDDA